MSRLPSIKIHAKAADLFSTNVVSRINQAKELLRFRLSKKWGVEEFCYPIHLVSIGQVKRDLHIFIGVFHHDNAIVINISILPFALEKDGATLLYFGSPKSGALEISNNFAIRERLDAAAMGLGFRFHWLNGGRVASH